jgi:cytochrome c553
MAASLMMLFMAMVCSPNALAQDSEALFREKCSGCHSIGGGDLVGPDLARTAAWPDAELQESIKRMEASVGPLTDAEVNGLKAYLKNAKPKSDSAAKSSSGTSSSASSPGGKDASATSPATEANSLAAAAGESSAEPASAEKGRKLFWGDEAFKNGGLSCIACHSVDGNGGNMAPDLTGISQKMAASALVSACEHTPYKVMKTAYKSHAILHQEALDLQAYLSSLKEPHSQPKKQHVALMGLGFAGVVFAIIAFGYRGRKKSARSKLQRRD